MNHTVVGVELVESAIELFFKEHEINFSIQQLDDFKCFTVKKISFHKFSLRKRSFVLEKDFFVNKRVKMRKFDYTMGIFSSFQSRIFLFEQYFHSKYQK